MDRNKSRFLLIVPPGLESLASRELEARGFALPASAQPLRGGFEVELDPSEGYQLNYLSHIGTRVLERLEKWRCRDFPKLFNKTQSLEWEKWIAANAQLEVEVSARKSRLMNKKRIAETVEKAILARLKKYPPKLKSQLATQKIFVRFFNDEVELSLDTSGEALFKRGYKVQAEAAAPIRENLAAAVFWATYEAAGKPTRLTVLDPTCGTGTLLTEAAQFFKNKPPRSYAFEAWSKEPALRSPSVLAPVQMTLIGLDRDQQTIARARENAERAGVAVQLEARDFLTEQVSYSQPLIGIANPPYGERIQYPVPPKEFYRGLCRFFEEAGCQVYAFIVPRNKANLLAKPKQRIDFENGGLPVALFIYTRQ
jgi:23S rRNA G2445 N2-methylase RlmL